MSTIALAPFLRISTQAGVTLHRWQSWFIGELVTLDGASWQPMQFEASGITNGQTGDESGLTLTMPAIPALVDAMFAAVADRHVWNLTVYQFVPGRFDQRIISSQFTGVVVSASSTLTEITLGLGSTLEPVGAQIPPRSMTTRLIGKGCRL